MCGRLPALSRALHDSVALRLYSSGRVCRLLPPDASTRSLYVFIHYSVVLEIGIWTQVFSKFDQKFAQPLGSAKLRDMYSSSQKVKANQILRSSARAVVPYV